MADYNFRIDQAFGPNMHMIVKDGLVKDIINTVSPKWKEKFMSEYGGMNIGEVKIAFEKRMEGVYYNVRPSELISVIVGINAADSRKRNAIQQANPAFRTISEEVKESILLRENILINELMERGYKLIDNLKSVHGYDCYELHPKMMSYNNFEKQ